MWSVPSCFCPFPIFMWSSWHTFHLFPLSSAVLYVLIRFPSRPDADPVQCENWAGFRGANKHGDPRSAWRALTFHCLVCFDPPHLVFSLFLCTRMLLLVYTDKWTSGSIWQSLTGRLIHSPFGRLFMQGGERSMQTKAQKIVQGLPILPLPPHEEFSGSVTIGHYASLCNFLSKLLSRVHKKGNDVKERPLLFSWHAAMSKDFFWW